jgi:hypothetical protein
MISTAKLLNNYSTIDPNGYMSNSNRANDLISNELRLLYMATLYLPQFKFKLYNSTYCSYPALNLIYSTLCTPMIIILLPNANSTCTPNLLPLNRRRTDGKSFPSDFIFILINKCPGPRLPSVTGARYQLQWYLLISYRLSVICAEFNVISLSTYCYISYAVYLLSVRRQPKEPWWYELRLPTRDLD